ncbi:hypothetical protein [Nitrosopumilus sp.]|uniref:hypothetical protein n=1 Tax=Nitrosopumilus sp. TaxID=2024843 RepID=UPI003B5B8C19
MIKQELKLQKQFDKKRETKKGITEYHKYVFVIPPDVIKLMGWDDDKLKDVEFEAKAHPKTGKLTIERK